MYKYVPILHFVVQKSGDMDAWNWNKIWFNNGVICFGLKMTLLSLNSAVSFNECVCQNVWYIVAYRRQHSKTTELQFFRKSLFKLFDRIWPFWPFRENARHSSLSENCDFVTVSAFRHLWFPLSLIKYEQNAETTTKLEKKTTLKRENHFVFCFSWKVAEMQFRDFRILATICCHNYYGISGIK